VSPLDALLAHADVAALARRLAARTGRRIEPDGVARLAAIALVLRSSTAGNPELLMIKRAELESDPWSGHVACPGGRMEPTDRDLEHTAMRETWEETGVDLERNGRMLGTLDDISPRTPHLPPLIIRPYVAIVKPDVTIVASEEVAAAFWVPLSAIRESTAWGREVVRVRGVGEREEAVFRHGDYLVWGLTHRALTQFLELLTREGGAGSG
jgi:8-oxo-dGTP pyrophosphatase MutT (NUDIX family)